MPDFQYSARDLSGQHVNGIRSALSEEDLAFQLQQESLIPIDINKVTKPLEKSNKLSRRFSFLKTKVPREDLQIFCRQMYTVLKAGIPLGTAVSKLAETTHDQQLAQTLQKILVSINQGRSLNISLSQFPGIFSEFFINLVKVGESTGKLDTIFLHLAEYLELEVDTKKKIQTAFRYPMLVLIAIFVALMVINAFVIPAFANMFRAFHGILLLLTRILIATSDFIISYWYLLVGLFIGSVVGVRAYVKTTAGELEWAKLQLNIPVIGWLIHRIILARFARFYALVLRAGLTADDGLELVGVSTGNALCCKKDQSCFQVSYPWKHGIKSHRANPTLPTLGGTNGDSG